MAPNSLPQSPSFWYRLVHLEPVLWKGLVVAVFALVGSLGVIYTEALPDQIVGFIVALAAIIQVLWVRPSVIPAEKVVLYSNDPANGLQLKAGPAVPSPSVSDMNIEGLTYQRG